MQSYLSDDDQEADSPNEDNAKKYRKRSEIPLDSLEISKKNLNELNDDEDCETVSLSNF